MKTTKKYRKFYLCIIAVIGYFAVLALLRNLYNYNLSTLGSEILASVVGAMIIIVVTVLVVGFQNTREQEREHRNMLFDKKLEVYRDFLQTIFKADDDNILSDDEVQDIENKVGVMCLFANEKLVAQFSQFIYQLKTYGVLYFRSLETDTRKKHFRDEVAAARKKKQRNSFLASGKYDLPKDTKLSDDVALKKYFLSLDELVQGMRKDLGVVEGDIERNIDLFMNIPYNHAGTISSPNIIDERRQNIPKLDNPRQSQSRRASDKK